MSVRIWQRAVECEFLNKMSHASHIRTLFSLVGRAWMEILIKYTLVFFFVEYGVVTKKTNENKCLT